MSANTNAATLLGIESQKIFLWIYGFGFLIANIAFTIMFWDYYLEDAFIHLRYTENTVESGQWSIWNLGESPVSGSSSPLWLGVLVIFRFFGVDAYAVSKLISSASLFGLSVLLLNQMFHRTRSQSDLLFFSRSYCKFRSFFMPKREWKHCRISSSY
jgi:hypothetical protein